MRWLLFFWLTFRPIPVATPSLATHSYKMTWTYDCAHWATPKKFEYGVYNNGVFTPITTVTVPAVCHIANYRFTVIGNSDLVPAPIYYVRGVNAVGGFGPAAFYPLQ
jgi:hypothetical protein